MWYAPLARDQYSSGILRINNWAALKISRANNVIEISRQWADTRHPAHLWKFTPLVRAEHPAMWCSGLLDERWFRMPTPYSAINVSVSLCSQREKARREGLCRTRGAPNLRENYAYFHTIFGATEQIHLASAPPPPQIRTDNETSVTRGCVSDKRNLI